MIRGFDYQFTKGKVLSVDTLEEALLKIREVYPDCSKQGSTMGWIFHYPASKESCKMLVGECWVNQRGNWKLRIADAPVPDPANGI